MTLQLTPALEVRLQHVAAETKRSPDELAEEAINFYLQSFGALAAEVQEAEEEADREGWLSSEQVEDRLDQRFRTIA